LDPSNHNTPTYTGWRVVVLWEARTCLNSHVPHVPLFFTSVSTPTLKSSHKTMTYPRYREPPVTVQNSGYDWFPQVGNGWGTTHLIPDEAPPLLAKEEGPLI
jgi:hypothetical protein